MQRKDNIQNFKCKHVGLKAVFKTDRFFVIVPIIYIDPQILDT